MNKPEQEQDDNESWKKFAYDRATRLAVVARSHYLFFKIYFKRYAVYEMAPFHMEFFAITHDKDIKTAVIESFRNSGKSTIMNFSYPIWAIVGEQQKKFVLLIARTESQARQYLANIKTELTSNERLRSDLGPFQEPDDEWRAVSIVLPQYGARITAVSIDQSVRGLRHGPHRPDLIICDDLEDLGSIKSVESRDKLYNWLIGDIIPMGDLNTKMIVIGTRLHLDSLIMRLKRKIEDGDMLGYNFFYPLVDDDGNIAWLNKFPNMEAIEMERKKLGNDISWQREYLLKIVPDDYQVINQDWIKYYDELPPGPPRYTFTAVDPAMSQKQTADYTAMVSAYVYGEGENLRIYILPNPVNKRGMEFSEMLERMREFSRNLAGGSHLSRILIEDVALQSTAQIQTLQKEGYPIEGIKTGISDKRTRLVAISNLIQNGKVLFPRKGTEKLIQQIVFFGPEPHDDLVDALTMLLGKIMVDESRPWTGVTWHSWGQLRGPRSIWDDDDDF